MGAHRGDAADHVAATAADVQANTHSHAIADADIQAVAQSHAAQAVAISHTATIAQAAA